MKCQHDKSMEKCSILVLYNLNHLDCYKNNGKTGIDNIIVYVISGIQNMTYNLSFSVKIYLTMLCIIVF